MLPCTRCCYALLPTCSNQGPPPLSQIVALLDSRSAEADYAAATRRTTALYSATLHSNLGALASLSLREPAAVGFSYEMVDGAMVVQRQGGQGDTEQGATQGEEAQLEHQQRRGIGGDAAWQAATAAAAGGPAPAAGTATGAAAGQLEQFVIPAQLQQRFVEVPCKLRLVALAALLRARVASAPASCKMVVFLSTTDSVEYYHSGGCVSVGAVLRAVARWVGRTKGHGSWVWFCRGLAEEVEHGN